MSKVGYMESDGIKRGSATKDLKSGTQRAIIETGVAVIDSAPGFLYS